MTWTSQHKMEDRVVINVSGMTFETKAKTLSRFPDTLLGSPTRRQKYFNPAAQEYFFNRHRVVFESILFYYQSGGRLIWPEDVPGSIFTEEVEFFQLGEQALKNVAKCLYKERKRTSPQLSFQRKVWNLFEHPDTSHFARAIAILSILMILMSVTISCVETLPYFKGLRAAEDCNTITRASLRCNESAASEFVTEDCDSKKFDNEDCSDNTLEIFMVLEIICYSWFLFEYLVRFASAPNRSRFLLSPLNFVDLLAIIPFFTILISGNRRWVSLAVLRTTRLLRIFRILKLTRYSHGLKVLMFTLRASISELEMMVLFMFMIVLLSSSAVFYTDFGADGSQFNSIPDAFWWSMTTVSTVGYGDYYPVTSFGKFVGGVCAVFGVLAFSLPVMAFAINFNAYLLGEPIRRHIENKSTTRTTRASMRGQ